VEFGGPPEAVPDAGPFDLLVNATSVGMGDPEAASPIPARALRPKVIVLDAVIRPRNTALLREAKKAGCSAVPGSRMLLYQGLFQFELFTGARPPVDAMRSALDRALR
jgi:shikimate 5-dehydrogenase